MTDDRAEYRALMVNPLAIKAVRARQRGSYGAVPQIPLYCSGHRTGMAIILGVRKGTDEGVHVQDHLIMYPAHDINAGKAATRARGNIPQPIDWTKPTAAGQQFPWGDDYPASHAIFCGTCDHTVRRKKVWLLREAIERVVNSGKRPYRISIT